MEEGAFEPPAAALLDGTLGIDVDRTAAHIRQQMAKNVDPMIAAIKQWISRAPDGFPEWVEKEQKKDPLDDPHGIDVDRTAAHIKQNMEKKR